MEYLPFGDLRNYLSGVSPLREAEAQQVTFQILEGLSFMHENGFAHRDLKPSVSPLKFTSLVDVFNVVYGTRIFL
jgi:serine/threonine protein kinase